MNIELSLSEAAVQYGGTLVAPDCQFSDVSIDSRTIQDGELFVALRGERFDGHDFLKQIESKACGAVVESFSHAVDLPQWVVPDTTKALGQLAALKRKQFKGLVIGITGSSGKTTVKEMVASILVQKGGIVATKGNLNNQIGVPLTLFDLRLEHEYAVIEMGASAAGDIAYLCTMATPDVAVVNNVLPAHIAGFGSVDAIARAKGEIYESLGPNGAAVVNLDEEYRNDWVSSCAARRVLTFSVTGKADFTAREIEKNSSGCYCFVMVAPDGAAQIKLPMPGKHSIANALSAAVCAFAVGASIDEIAQGINTVASIDGRMRRLNGVSNSTVIDDTYNANPGSMLAAIDALCDLDEQKILVMGDMAELGEDAAIIHGEMGRYAKRVGIDYLFTVGPLSYEAAHAFGENAQHFSSKDALIAGLVKILTAKSTALVKGSRSAEMEDVVNAIIRQEAT